MNNKITSDESSAIPVKDTGIILSPDIHRVILRPHIPFSEARIERIISRVLSLDEPEVKKELTNVTCQFSGRHKNFEAQLERQFESVRRYMPSDVPPSRDRQLLIGSFFLGEYSFESTALFNPSIIPHPDQTGLFPDLFVL